MGREGFDRTRGGAEMNGGAGKRGWVGKGRIREGRGGFKGKGERKRALLGWLPVEEKIRCSLCLLFYSIMGDLCPTSQGRIATLESYKILL